MHQVTALSSLHDVAGLFGTQHRVQALRRAEGRPLPQAGILGESFSDARAFGWDVQAGALDWNKMVTGIQDHIGGLNFGYRVALRDKKARLKGALIPLLCSPPPSVC